MKKKFWLLFTVGFLLAFCLPTFLTTICVSLDISILGGGWAAMWWLYGYIFSFFGVVCGVELLIQAKVEYKR